MRRRLNIGLLLVLAGLCLYLTYLVLEPFFQPILAAVVLAVSFQPLHARLRRRLRRPNLVALVSVLIVVMAVLTPVGFIAATVGRELAALASSLAQQSADKGGFAFLAGGWMDRGAAWLSRYVDVSGFDVKQRLLAQMQAWSGTLVGKAGSLLGNLGSFAFKAVITLVAMFFFLREGELIQASIVRHLPIEREQLERIFQGVGDTIQASMYGMMAVASAQALLVGLGFFTLGLPNPVLWGSVTIFASFIPVVGTALVWAPGAVWLWVAGSWMKAVILVAWGAGVVGMADNILRPLVMSGRVRTHPLLLFFALLGGAQAFGLIGLFAGPVILALTETVLALIREETEKG
jgi:predicted PurR-regulated permease PerM